MTTSFNIKDQINHIDDLYLRTKFYILKDTVAKLECYKKLSLFKNGIFQLLAAFIFDHFSHVTIFTSEKVFKNRLEGFSSLGMFLSENFKIQYYTSYYGFTGKCREYRPIRSTCTYAAFKNITLTIRAEFAKGVKIEI